MTYQEIERMHHLEQVLAEYSLIVERARKEHHALVRKYRSENGMSDKGTASHSSYKISCAKCKVLAPLAEKIRECRLERGLSMQEAAEMYGCKTYQSIYSIERGKTTPIKDRIIKMYPELEGAPEWVMLESFNTKKNR